MKMPSTHRSLGNAVFSLDLDCITGLKAREVLENLIGDQPPFRGEGIVVRLVELEGHPTSTARPVDAFSKIL
jgi:hypothetical protein